MPDTILSPHIGFYHSILAFTPDGQPPMKGKQKVYAARKHTLQNQMVPELYREVLQVLILYNNELTWINCREQDLELTGHAL